MSAWSRDVVFIAGWATGVWTGVCLWWFALWTDERSRRQKKPR